MIRRAGYAYPCLNSSLADAFMRLSSLLCVSDVIPSSLELSLNFKGLEISLSLRTSQSLFWSFDCGTRPQAFHFLS